jgi:predicted HD phosphohydrolase
LPTIASGLLLVLCLGLAPAGGALLRGGAEAAGAPTAKDLAHEWRYKDSKARDVHFVGIAPEESTRLYSETKWNRNASSSMGRRVCFTHVHVTDRYNFELTVYPEDKAHYVFKSSITGKAIERLSIRELEALLASEDPGFDPDSLDEEADASLDRFEIYRQLLRPLEGVKQSARYHPEGDALYHSLQVFELARAERPYDAEFLLAALLHDVGKAIDPSEHVQAGLQALEGTISERTGWLIAHHMEAQAYRSATLGGRATARLRAHEHFDDLLLLADLDRRGRVPGADVPELDVALRVIEVLAAEDHADE